MADIKTKKKQEVSIKKLDRATIMEQNLKSNIINIKDKTKENYEKSENTAQEYAENKVNSTMHDIIYYTPRLNRKGKQSFEETMQNIEKGKVQIKKAQKGIKNVKRKEKITINKAKRNIKRVQNTVKSAKNTVKTTGKATKQTIKTTKQVAQSSVKLAQRTAQMTKQAVKTTIQATKVAIKTTISIIKAIIASMKALVSAIIAGGWVAVVVIVVICFVGLICSSIFGIFFSSEKGVGNRTMSSVISEINTEYINKITEIQKNNEYDQYEIKSNRTEWKDIISIYAVVESKGKEQTDIITIDERKSNELKEIFWKMNTINYKIEEIEQDVEIKDDNGNVKSEKKLVKKLYIETFGKTLQEMIEMYELNEKQKEQIAELQDGKYDSVWRYLLVGSSTGSNDIVEVAKQYIGNVGGQPFWSWYGFDARVEWCACFVSFCANQCGYIEQGIIPKFASCESEGVAWFKACNLWQERDYIAKAGDIIFFDWADSNDGKADHVGIVEKVENETVYTIEGNTRGDMCKQNQYNINSSVILGYGTLAY